MSQILTPFNFSFQVGGEWKTIEIDLYGDFFPLKPVFTAIGMSWKKVQVNITNLEYIRPITVGRGGPSLCTDVEGFLKIVSNINPNRVRNKETFLFFVKFLPAAILERLEELKPRATPDDLKPMFETDVGEIADKDEIVFYRQLSPRDLYRKELPSVGVKCPDEIDFLCGAYHAMLYKPDPNDPYGDPLISKFPIDSYRSGQLREYARDGFYLRPEYFRRFPHLYKYRTQLEREVIRQPDGKIIDMKRYVKVPEGGAPWYTAKFADRMADLVILNREVKEKQDRERFAKLVNSGEDYDLFELIGEIDMGVFDEDFFNEYGKDDEADDEA